MKVLMICFSQTGNTEKIAKRIQNGIVESGNSCRIVSIKDADPEKLTGYDLIGIGVPTFYYREPLNVTTFIQRMDRVDGRHCFLFCTHGSIIGNTFYYLQEGLKAKGYLVVGAFDTYADSSLQFYPEIMHTFGHPDEIELSGAEEFGKNICSRSMGIQKKELEPIPEFPLAEDTWWAKASRVLVPSFLQQLFPKFVINPDKCTGCSLCRDNCPVDAIIIESHPPENQPKIQMEGCIYCMYCEKICPEGAILVDWEDTKKGLSGNLAKYVAELKEAEKEGRFRPYVDYEKII
jgi:ferredoxin